MSKSGCEYCRAAFKPIGAGQKFPDGTRIVAYREIRGKNLMNRQSDLPVKAEICKLDGKYKLRLTYDDDENDVFFSTAESRTIKYCPMCGRKL